MPDLRDFVEKEECPDTEMGVGLEKLIE